VTAPLVVALIAAANVLTLPVPEATHRRQIRARKDQPCLPSENV
jgi:hypothetical protein